MAMASPCYCNVIAMSVLCHCQIIVMSLPCHCRVHMPCHCHVICPTVCVMIYELLVAAWCILSACWHFIAMFLTIDHVIATHTTHTRAQMHTTHTHTTHANTHPRTRCGGEQPRRRQDHSGALSMPLPSRALLATVFRATCSCIACGW